MAVLVLVLAGCSAGQEKPDPAASASVAPLEGVATFEDLSADHVDGPVSYDQDPPVGGEHNARWLACDVYDVPVPNELAVHSMEHGGVWITHDPDLPSGDLEALAALAELNRQYVLVSPYADLPAPVVASAWGLQLEVESADDLRLEDFVRTYAGGDQGGEPGAPCRDGGLTLDEARQLVGG